MARGTYSPGDEYLDTLYTAYGDAPTTDPKLSEQYVQLQKIRAELYKGLSKEAAQYRIAALTTQAKLYSEATKTAAQVAETIGRNNRVTAQNFTALKKAKEANDVELTKKLSAPTPAFAGAQTAFDGASGGAAGARAAAAALTSWQDFNKRGLDPTSPDIAPLMNRFSTMVLNGKTLDQTTPDEIVSALGDAPDSMRQQIRSLVTAGKQRWDDMLTLQRTNQEEVQELNALEEQYRRAGVGSADARKVEGRVKSMADNLSTNLMTALGSTPADIEAERQMLVDRNSAIAKIDRSADILEERAFGAGGASAREKIGRLIATPMFKQWAEGNGYTLGRAEVDEKGNLIYVPTAADNKMVSLFIWQTKHPEKYGPLFASKTTGKYVRVTTEDPERRAEVMQKFRGGDGTFYLQDGALVSPGEAQKTLAEGGFVPTVQFAEAGGKGFMRLPDGTVLDAATRQPVTAPAGLSFTPAVKYDANGKPLGYLTVNDARDTAVGAGPLEEGDRADLATVLEQSPIRTASEEQVRDQWTGEHYGYLDRPHAFEMISGTGPSTISLDGGKVKVPGGQRAIIEVIEKGETPILSKAERRELADRRAQEVLDGRPVARGPEPTVSVPVVTPGGTTTTAELPISSNAAQLAAAEGRPMEIGGTAQAPAAAAPTKGAAAPATAPAPAVMAPAPAAPKAESPAAPALRYIEDDAGNVFSFDGASIKLEKSGPGQPEPKTKEWKPGTKGYTDVAKVLGEKGKEVEAPKPAVEPGPAPVPTAKDSKKAPLPEGAKVGARGTSAVVSGGGMRDIDEAPSMLDKVRGLFKRKGAGGTSAPPVATAPVERPDERAAERKIDEKMATALAGADAGVPETRAERPAGSPFDLRDEAFVKTLAASRPEIKKQYEAMQVARRESPDAYGQFLRDVAGTERRKLRPSQGETGTLSGDDMESKAPAPAAAPTEPAEPAQPKGKLSTFRSFMPPRNPPPRNPFSPGAPE